MDSCKKVIVAGVFDDIKMMLRRGDSLTWLIAVNCVAFVVVCAVSAVSHFISADMGWFYSWFFLSSSAWNLLTHPWQILTYAFIHGDFIHFIINVLLLAMAGRLFKEFFSTRDLVGVYLLSALIGGACFIAACEIMENFGMLSGCSASVMALIVAPAVYAPNYEIYLTLIGRVRLKWIAFVYVLITLLNMFSVNWAGQFAHLGGIATGVVFAWLLKNKRINITAWIWKIVDSISKKNQPKFKVAYQNPEFRIKTEKELLDDILDKIKISGYDSLSATEREFLRKMAED